MLMLADAHISSLGHLWRLGCKRGQKSELKKVIKQVRLYSCENSFIIFRQARLELSDLFGREWLTTEYIHSHLSSALLFQKQIKSTERTVTNRKGGYQRDLVGPTCRRAITHNDLNSHGNLYLLDLSKFGVPLSRHYLHTRKDITFLWELWPHH